MSRAVSFTDTGGFPLRSGKPKRLLLFSDEQHHGEMDAHQHTIFKGHFNYDVTQRVPLLIKPPSD